MYSQNNEERIIALYFRRRRRRIGTFLDLGANDGQTLSNTRQLAKIGWTGTLVEMVPQCVSELKALYANSPNIQVIDKAIGIMDGRTDMYESAEHGGNNHGLISTIMKSETKRWKGTEFYNFTKTKVECISVSTLLSQLQHERYNFISIDIEGMDYEVLIQLNLRELGCEMLCVEFNNKEAQKYIDYCKQFGLKEIHRNGENLIFGL